MAGRAQTNMVPVFSADDLFDVVAGLETDDAITFDVSLVTLWSDGFAIAARQPCQWLGQITAIEPAALQD